MTLDRVLGLLAIAGFVAYLSVLLFRVPQFPLIAVIVVVLAMAIWDFWLTLRPRRQAKARAKAKEPQS